MMKNTGWAAAIFFLFLAPAAHASGIQFHEIMRGKIQTAPKEKLSFKLDMIARVTDIDAWAADPGHPAALAGKAYVEGIMIPVTGTLNLSVPGDSPDGQHGHVLHYHFASAPGAIPSVEFEGAKFVPMSGIKKYLHLISEITTLIGVTKFQLDENDAVTEAPTRVVFPWYDPFVMVPFMASFKISGAHGNELERVRVRTKFIGIYFGGLLKSSDAE